MIAKRAVTLIFSVSVLIHCSAPAPEQVGKDGWLAGSPGEQMHEVARQLRGNDVAMWEIGYRYGELYWAGREENWDLAAYQLQKIKKSMDLAIVRRPKRAESYEVFFANGLPPVTRAVDAKDGESFEAGFQALTTACNACHIAENLAFFQVRQPVYRPAPLGSDGE
ncbi:hypothetical protein SCOR_06155 [Sulfidibacter corallicola]|uniref:Cytochrome c domain-containing protein n=1 Tax=Sulfidibacter corallicola TaxID=2818388 RepID=A0A8A4TQE8_SULCO|nr:hypothetical protein [Sulfidibacter corallicola]QTD51647.1 hypothetical protein J3U87_04185 [Sulfidibacter corallicola]